MDKGPSDWTERGGGGEWGVGPAAPPSGSPDNKGSSSSLELGELEQLTINNDNDLNYDQITAPKVSKIF